MGLVVALLAMWVLGAAPAKADSGLLGEWHLDHVDPGNPPTTADSSGHGLTGTDVRGTLVPGRFGSGLQFTATGDGVDVPDAPALEPNRMTVIAWVKWTGRGNPPQFRTIVGKGASGCSSRSYLLDVGSTSGGLRFGVTLNASAVVVAEVPAAGIWDGQWHAIAGTYDGATAGLWVDGVEISSTPAPAAFTDVDYVDYGPPGDTRLAFGRYVQPQGSCDQSGFQFLGALDEVRIYGRALSASEISYLQTAPGPTPPELPPAVTGVSPSSGPAAGGTS
jgi:sialidase-1